MPKILLKMGSVTFHKNPRCLCQWIPSQVMHASAQPARSDEAERRGANFCQNLGGLRELYCPGTIRVACAGTTSKRPPPAWSRLNFSAHCLSDGQHISSPTAIGVGLLLLGFCHKIRLPSSKTVTHRQCHCSRIWIRDFKLPPCLQYNCSGDKL